MVSVWNARACDLRAAVAADGRQHCMDCAIALIALISFIASTALNSIRCIDGIDWIDCGLSAVS
eukprot:656325-Lingulodinium_polyedra.AAC.1